MSYGIKIPPFPDINDVLTGAGGCFCNLFPIPDLW